MQKYQPLLIFETDMAGSSADKMITRRNERDEM